MMTFAGHDAGPRGTAIENDFLSTLSVMRSRLVASNFRNPEVIILITESQMLFGARLFS